MGRLGFSILALSLLLLAACARPRVAPDEILIGLKPEAAAQLMAPRQPDPVRTGLPSIDLLNQKWEVYQMIALFPDVSPTDEVAIRNGLGGIYKLKTRTRASLQTMLVEYRADANVIYAEINRVAETK